MNRTPSGFAPGGKERMGIVETTRSPHATQRAPESRPIRPGESDSPGTSGYAPSSTSQLSARRPAPLTLIIGPMGVWWSSLDGIGPDQGFQPIPCRCCAAERPDLHREGGLGDRREAGRTVRESATRSTERVPKDVETARDAPSPCRQRFRRLCPRNAVDGGGGGRGRPHPGPSEALNTRRKGRHVPPVHLDGDKYRRVA